MEADKALKKLEDMPLADRIAAVAADVDSKQDEFRSIDAHELASLLGIVDAEHPGGGWNFEWFIPRVPVDDILDQWDEETIVELFQSQLTPERYKELCSKIDLREKDKTNYAKVLEFLTDDENQKIEEHYMEWQAEHSTDSAWCSANISIEAPHGKILTFQAFIEDDGACIELKTPYDERDGKFTDYSDDLEI
jgi:hypothetical protein